MVAHKLAPAFATNNCVVLKPTELTPLTALFLADTLYEAGLPPEMLSVITGNPSDIGDAMIVDPRADLITFTGSVRVGKYIAEKAGYKRIVLELGGNDPLIVMEDADLDKAADLAVAGATKNSGQRCTAVKRIIVVDKVADAFVERVLARAKKLKAGDPLDPETDVGTVIHERAATLFQNRVNEAVAKHGAKLLHGNDRQGALFPPTVVDHVDPTCELVREETFGPGDPDHPRQGHRPRHPGVERHGLRPVVRRLHRPARTTSRASSTSCRSARSTSGRCRAIASRCRRSAASRIRPRLQGRRARGDEELHQREDLVAALAGLKVIGLAFLPARRGSMGCTDGVAYDPSVSVKTLTPLRAARREESALQFVRHSMARRSFAPEEVNHGDTDVERKLPLRRDRLHGRGRSRGRDDLQLLDMLAARCGLGLRAQGEVQAHQGRG
jgi:hypothetical protein